MESLRVFLMALLMIAPLAAGAAAPAPPHGGGTLDASELERGNATLEPGKPPVPNASEPEPDAVGPLTDEDPWLNVAGDRMLGPIRMDDNEVQWFDKFLGVQGEDLVYDGSAVCTSGPQFNDCGDITEVRAGFGLSGGGKDGVATLNVVSTMVQMRVDEVCGAGSAIRAIDHRGDVTCEPVGGSGGAGWALGGNAGLVEGSNFLGTTDAVPLELRVNDQTAMRFLAAPDVHVLGGSSGFVASDIRGATISGGAQNRVYDSHSTVGGGFANIAGSGADPNDFQNIATVAGGFANNAAGKGASIGGGAENKALGHFTTVAGGQKNTACCTAGTIGGGFSNTANGWYSAIGGGHTNAASGNYAGVSGGAGNQASDLYATVGGGAVNLASGFAATVPGGRANEAGGIASWAGGCQAKVRAGDDGTFAWNSAPAGVQCSDGVPGFTSTGPGQFLVNAPSGVGIGTNAPRGALDVAGTIYADDLDVAGTIYADDLVLPTPPAQPHTITLPAVRFQPEVITMNTEYRQFPLDLHSASYPGLLRVGVHVEVPAGATITGIEAAVTDDNFYNNVNVNLTSANLNGPAWPPTPTTVVHLQSSGEPQATTLSADGLDLPVTSGDVYFVHVTLRNWFEANEMTRLHYVKVHYSL